jgi:hypothetical protein
MLFGMPQKVQDSLDASVPFPSFLDRPEDQPGWLGTPLRTTGSTTKSSSRTVRSAWRRSARSSQIVVAFDNDLSLAIMPT